MNVKLNLHLKTDAGVVDLGTTHQAAMTGNANFTTPVPTAAAFGAILDAAAAALADVVAKRAAWRTAVQLKDASIEALRTALNGRAGYVEAASEGDPAKILSAGFDVRTPSAPAQPLPAPTSVEASMGEMEGSIVVEWPPLGGADSYVIERSDNVLPRVYAQVKISTRASYTDDGLTSGQRYVYRVAAVGPLGQGPWSDEASKMAP